MEEMMDETAIAESDSPEAVAYDGVTEAAPEAAEVADPMPDHPVAAEEEAKQAEADANAEPEKKERRPRGWLEADVKTVIDKVITGEIKIEDGKALTPHRVARLVKDHDNLDEAPSSGAVAAVLNRWVDLGFVVVNDKPFSFRDYTDEGRTKGLTAMKDERKSRLSGERQAERDRIKAAKKAEKEAAAAVSATP